VNQNARDYLLEAERVDEVFGLLEHARGKGLPDVGREKNGKSGGESFETPEPDDSIGNVCVFCSATIEKRDYLEDGFTLGRLLAESRFGCITGAGKSGIMGEVVRGSVEAGGWTGGSNVPHIIELEGLPEGLSSFWLKTDIYTRMEIMIERSDAFVIFPGGAGTVQEMLALMIFKHQGNQGMAGKPVVVFNREDAGGARFWTPLIKVLRHWCDDNQFVVVEELDQIVPTVKRLLGR
jgi:hypothetical protein